MAFLGTVDHQVLKGAFQACQAFVFPTLQDLIGRVVVEALSAGAPVDRVADDGGGRHDRA